MGNVETQVSTFGFTAPEIFLPDGYDHRVDTYSLGRTIDKWMEEYKVNDNSLAALAKRMYS